MNFAKRHESLSERPLSNESNQRFRPEEAIELRGKRTYAILSASS